jgi:hypothetical protein
MGIITAKNRAKRNFTRNHKDDLLTAMKPTMLLRRTARHERSKRKIPSLLIYSLGGVWCLYWTSEGGFYHGKSP